MRRGPSNGPNLGAIRMYEAFFGCIREFWPFRLKGRVFDNLVLENFLESSRGDALLNQPHTLHCRASSAPAYVLQQATKMEEKEKKVLTLLYLAAALLLLIACLAAV